MSTQLIRVRASAFNMEHFLHPQSGRYLAYVSEDDDKVYVQDLGAPKSLPFQYGPFANMEVASDKIAELIATLGDGAEDWAKP